jgi:hypothetical protein
MSPADSNKFVHKTNKSHIMTGLAPTPSAAMTPSP